MHLSDDQLRAFAERGYIVVPNVVSRSLIDGAMQQIDQMIEKAPPPPDHSGFHFYWEQPSSDTDPLTAPLQRSNAWKIATSLIEPHHLEPLAQLQVSLNIPVWRHQPGGPHIDGLSVTEPDGRPGTFTLLAGILLTDQTATDMGNLWVWPGSHYVGAAYLRRHGADALFDIVHPTYPMAAPEQILGRAGDLFLAHYLLGHNMGGNTSTLVRRVVYFRLHAEGHRTRWRTCVQDALFEFEPVRAALARK
jgi:ectoine hydroxylase-related dioxygenase (phytanoyl-CoA dioxygenase family)